MDDANTILERLKVQAPFLAAGIEKTQRRIVEDAVTEQMLAVDRGEQDARAIRYNSLQREHEADLAKPEKAWEVDYPTHTGRIDRPLMMGKGTVLSLWVDNQTCKGMMKVFPANLTYYLEFHPLERPVLDRLYNAYQTGEHVAFARLINDTFVDEARSDYEKSKGKCFVTRYQASIVQTSQFDDSSIVRTAMVRLYWNEEQPVSAIIMDGQEPLSISLVPHKGRLWNSPTHMGELG